MSTAAGTAPGTALLEIDGLSVGYPRRGGRPGQRVLDGVSLHARAGEILGVIGETGSGKTTLARAVVGLAPVTGGRISVDGAEVTGLRGRALRDFRRTGRAQYLFQDPLRSLDPDLTVGALVAEPLAVTGTGSREQRTERAAEALHRVGLDPALADRLPGQLSGGQRQRVALARAVVTRPRLLLADEPVSALDASNRNHVLRLFDRLRNELDVAVVVISHDLSSLAGIADRIAVLYRGRLVEQGSTAEVLTRPLHPYTALLTASAPSVRREHSLTPAQLRADGPRPGWTLTAGPGAPGCGFAARCRFADDACRQAPPAKAITPGREAACHHAETWRGRLDAPQAAAVGA
ncbi:ABC transporter ATP-binding protein [Streptacidiphilus sp. PB12-B1b]|uniref:ABC transporter ATP-binding protein n=1 Tax=Streptacidiphilus sp. PB12-B1b TaxID=2705012 RepID=UPI0015FA2773|nr:ABC transporter ATP-binding protein [Streptacidiphilus sp. PB12-B1b]QMU77379.1 ABC transporter ATP-binding protein [Streptacidiphilus sp. PB12-B1b]